jgi:NDP-hexose 4-ketoreductase
VSGRIILIGASGWLGRKIDASHGPGLQAVAADAVLDEDRAPSRILAGSDLIINAAGAKGADTPTLNRYNIRLVELLVQAVDASGGHLVQLGSAAEYGLHQPGGVCREDAACLPNSPYGATKLAASLIAGGSGQATVLRVFNVLAVPPQPQSPLADVADRIAASAASGAPVELLSASTERDWVPANFLLDSIEFAAEHRPAGIFNVCSGRAVSMREAAERALTRLQAPNGVHDLKQFPPSVVVGSPEAWTDLSGLACSVNPDVVGDWLARIVRSHATSL